MEPRSGHPDLGFHFYPAVPAICCAFNKKTQPYSQNEIEYFSAFANLGLLVSAHAFLGALFSGIDSVHSSSSRAATFPELKMQFLAAVASAINLECNRFFVCRPFRNC